MNSNPTLVSRLMLQLKPQMKISYKRAEERWACLFQSCASAQNIDSGTLANIYSGRRPLPNEYITKYTDYTNPHAPVPLRKDIMNALQYLCSSDSVRVWYFNNLILFIQFHIDPVDQPNLLPIYQPTIPDLDATVLLFTTVMWYCLCHDYSRI